MDGKLSYVILVLIFIILVYIFNRHRREHFEERKDVKEVAHYIKRNDQDAPTVISNVPTVIYNSWHSNMVPPKMLENIMDNIAMNPDFDYYLYSDESSEEYIKNNYSLDVLNAFHTLKPGAFKSDLWRYCILYKMGGVYMDIKYKTLEPLRYILAKSPNVFVKDYDHLRTDKCFYNGVMISPPNNKIFKYCIDEIVDNCRMKLYTLSPLSLTGPCLLGKSLKRFKDPQWNTPKFTYESYKEYDRSERVDYISYDNRCIIQSYKGYRVEQMMYQKTEAYGKMWMEGQIFN